MIYSVFHNNFDANAPHGIFSLLFLKLAHKFKMDKEDFSILDCKLVLVISRFIIHVK